MTPPRLPKTKSQMYKEILEELADRFEDSAAACKESEKDVTGLEDQITYKTLAQCWNVVHNTLTQTIKGVEGGGQDYNDVMDRR